MACHHSVPLRAMLILKVHCMHCTIHTMSNAVTPLSHTLLGHMPTHSATVIMLH